MPSGVSHLADPDVVYNSDGTPDTGPSDSTCARRFADITGDNASAPTERQTYSDGLSIIRESFKGKNLSERSTKILMSAWRHGTQKQYASYIKKWFNYCSERKISCVQTVIADILDFLSQLVEQGLSYSAINTARSALSAIGLVIDGFTVGSHPLIIRFMKGVYNMKPPQARYCETWDVSVVLRYLKTLADNEKLSLKLLTLKLVMLIALVLASRCHSLHLLSIENMRKESSQYVLRYSGPLKQSRPGNAVPCAKLKEFTPDRRICVYNALNVYLLKTSLLRDEEKSLFISYVKPHRAVTSSTISRWIRVVMNAAGIDCSKFKSHSVRSASSSCAKRNLIPLQDIMKTAGWAREQTFCMFYDKPVVDPSTSTYSDAVLNSTE